jgi:hypothetical protein
MLVLAISHSILLLCLAGLVIGASYEDDDDIEVGVQLALIVALGCGILLLIGGGIVSIFGEVHFGMYALHAFLIPYMVLSGALLIFFLIFFLGQWVVRYARKKREARTTPDHEAIRVALEAGRVSETMRLYKVVNCLNEANINAALQEVLANWPIKETINEATSELLALQRSRAIALGAGVAQGRVDMLTEDSENLLNTIWVITNRVVAVRRQGVNSPRIQRALSLEEQRIRDLTQVVHEAREALAVCTVKGWEGQEIEEAHKKLSALLTALREQMDDTDSL